VCDVVMLVVQIGNQFSAGYVLHSDVVVHLFQRGTQHVGLYHQMLWTQRVRRMIRVQVLWIVKVYFQHVSDGCIVNYRVYDERIDLRLTQKSEIADW